MPLQPPAPPLQKPNDEVWFYKNGAEYDIFSNVTDIGFQINIGGENFTPKSSEAVYQGVKCLSNRAAPKEDIEKAKAVLNGKAEQGAAIQQLAARGSKHYGFRNNAVHNFYKTGEELETQYDFCRKSPEKDKFQEIIKGTLSIKEELMYQTLLCKFTQNPQLLQALLNTNDQLIVENTSLAKYDDHTWGNGWDGEGRNALGFALMRVREDLQKELTKDGRIEVRIGIDDQLADKLQLPHSSKPEAQLYIRKDALDKIPACTTVQDAKQKENNSEVQQVKQSITSKFNAMASTIIPTKDLSPADLAMKDAYFKHDPKFDHRGESPESQIRQTPIQRVLEKLNEHCEKINNEKLPPSIPCPCPQIKVDLKPEDPTKKGSECVFYFRWDKKEDAEAFRAEFSDINSGYVQGVPPKPNEPQYYIITLEETEAQKLFEDIGAKTHGRKSGYEMVAAIKHQLDFAVDDSAAEPQLSKPPKPPKPPGPPKKSKGKKAADGKDPEIVDDQEESGPPKKGESPAIESDEEDEEGEDIILDQTSMRNSLAIRFQKLSQQYATIALKSSLEGAAITKELFDEIKESFIKEIARWRDRGKPPEKEEEKIKDYDPKYKDDEARYTLLQRQTFIKHFSKLYEQLTVVSDTDTSKDSLTIKLPPESDNDDEEKTVNIKFQPGTPSSTKSKEVSAELEDQKTENRILITSNSTSDLALFTVVDAALKGAKKMGGNVDFVIRYPSCDLESLAKLTAFAKLSGLSPIFKCRLGGPDPAQDQQDFAKFNAGHLKAGSNFNKQIAAFEKEFAPKPGLVTDKTTPPQKPASSAKPESPESAGSTTTTQAEPGAAAASIKKLETGEKHVKAKKN